MALLRSTPHDKHVYTPWKPVKQCGFHLVHLTSAFVLSRVSQNLKNVSLCFIKQGKKTKLMETATWQVPSQLPDINLKPCIWVQYGIIDSYHMLDDV